MKFRFSQSVLQLNRPSSPSGCIFCVAAAALAVACLQCASAATPTGALDVQVQPTKKAPAPPPHKAVKQSEQKTGANLLAERVATAVKAREAGDAAQVAAANRLVIATALRQFADLRVVQGAYPQAVEAYRASLSFEDSIDTRVELAVAEIQTGQYDDAIKLAEQAHAAEPHNLRADRALASAYVQKGDNVKALEPFSRIAKEDPAVDNLYPLAVTLLQTHKPEDKQRAIATFQQMEKEAGDSGSLHVLIGRAYRDADDMQSAVAEFQRAIAMDPHTPHAHYFLGLARLFMNDWKPSPEAEAELRKEAANYPTDYLANYMLGFLTSGERNYDESNKYLLQASKIDPSAPEPFLYMGLNAYSQDDMKTAETMLRKAVELTGSDEARSNYQIRRAYVDLGRILAQSGREDESDVFIAKARALQNKTMVQTQEQVSNIMLAAGAGAGAAVVPLSRKQEAKSAGMSSGDGSEALAGVSNTKLTEEQRAAIQDQEKTLRAVLGLAFNDLATSEAVRQDYTHALADYQQAEHWDNTLPGLEKNLGLCAFRSKDYVEATRALPQALAQQPDSKALRAMLGISYFATDKFADAARTFSPLGEPGAHDSAVGYPWAASLTHLGDMKRATEVLEVFESEPLSNDALLLDGQLWTEIGDFDHATAALQRALQSDPSLKKAHFYLGLVDIHAQKWPEAAQEFQTELRLSPGDADAEYHLGFVYLQQSKIDEAAAQFRQVLAHDPKFANAQYELGKILLDRGKFAEAVTHLEAAVQLSSGTDYMHYQLQAAYRKADRPADADRELEIYKQLKAQSRERAAGAAKPTN